MAQQTTQLLRRPTLGPPRRSFSVMDYQPLKITEKPGENLLLENLPIEVHHVIFDFLDDIDGTCLGLTNSHFYAMQRNRIGTVALTRGRAGPNDLEWCWTASGPMLQGCSPEVLRKTFPLRTTEEATAAAVQRYLDFSQYRLKGKQWCMKCRHHRCQLWKHVEDFFPGQEMCTISGKFGKKVDDPDRDRHCRRRSPRDSTLCGRHRPRKARAGEAK